jgi:SAM-dependent methyltransferase
MRKDTPAYRMGRSLPPKVRRALRRVHAPNPRRSVVHLDQRLKPIQRDPWARGLPIDRYYIDRFFERWNNAETGDIAGSVLEFYDTRYASAVGGWGGAASRVARVDVIDVMANPRATIRADIADAPELPSAAYDAIVCTQVLQYLPDPHRGVATLRRLLRPGGVLYITVPGLAPNRGPVEGGGIEYSRFTIAGTEAMLRRSFLSGEFVVQAFGNVLTAIASLHGLASDEFSASELDFRDPAFEVLIVARAQLPQR